MTDVVLVDDHLLLRILLEDEPSSLRTSDERVATTGLWYHRLCRALADDTVVGSMSRRLGSVRADVAAGVVGAVVDLPSSIELVSFRTLAWPMAELVASGSRLDLLSLEAVVAALHLDAEICLAAANDNERLRDAGVALGLRVRVLDD